MVVLVDGEDGDNGGGGCCVRGMLWWVGSGWVGGWVGTGGWQYGRLLLWLGLIMFGEVKIKEFPVIHRGSMVKRGGVL